MTILQASHFTDAALLPALQQLSDADLDALEFGVIGIDAAGLVRRYNTWESRMAGLSPLPMAALSLAADDTAMSPTTSPSPDYVAAAARAAGGSGAGARDMVTAFAASGFGGSNENVRTVEVA